jgi:hypothetical protein
VEKIHARRLFHIKVCNFPSDIDSAGIFLLRRSNMAINIHPADALIHRLLQQQSSSSNHKTTSQQKAGSNGSEKVTISEQAKNASEGQSPSKPMPSLLQLYGPRGN